MVVALKQPYADTLRFFFKKPLRKLFGTDRIYFIYEHRFLSDATDVSYFDRDYRELEKRHFASLPNAEAWVKEDAQRRPVKGATL